MNSGLIILFTKTAFCCKHENGKSIYERLDIHFYTHGSKFPETEKKIILMFVPLLPFPVMFHFPVV